MPAILIAGCSLMTTPEDDPVLLQLEELDRRLQAVERVMENQSLVQLAQQVDMLERRTDALQGVAETLSHEATGTAERQRLLYSDLDTRIQELEANLQAVHESASVLDGGSLSQGELPIPGGSDRDNYRVALELLREERYDQSAASFQQFLIAFPKSQLASNAQYWLAESYYASNQFEKALADFAEVIEKYPSSSKVPDALLKMGYCNYSLKRWNDARVALSRVQAEYPTTTAARLADQYLKRMQSEGV
ncbi:MAG: tol-pal system protein YbgF [Gammaproteobacteria bacterium]|nr:tol-pal system protein YbgF [Gammaproteobacteria bacterium]